MGLSIFDSLEEANEELERAENEVVIPGINKDEILKNYEFNFDVDNETMDFLKEQTVKVHNKANTFYTDLGKIFKETQEVLSQKRYGCFYEWFEQLGFKKDLVYRYINRYNLIVAQSDIENVKKIEALPVTLSYEIAKESCPEMIRERVLAGEIKTKSELKKAIKEVQQEDIEEVQEAEIVVDYKAEIKKEFEEILKVLSNAEKVVSYNENNLNALVKIKKILTGLE